MNGFGEQKRSAWADKGKLVYLLGAALFVGIAVFILLPSDPDSRPNQFSSDVPFTPGTAVAPDRWGGPASTSRPAPDSLVKGPEGSAAAPEEKPVEEHIQDAPDAPASADAPAAEAKAPTARVRGSLAPIPGFSNKGSISGGAGGGQALAGATGLAGSGEGPGRGAGLDGAGGAGLSGRLARKLTTAQRILGRAMGLNPSGRRAAAGPLGTFGSNIPGGASTGFGTTPVGRGNAATTGSGIGSSPLPIPPGGASATGGGGGGGSSGGGGGSTPPAAAPKPAAPHHHQGAQGDTQQTQTAVHECARAWRTGICAAITCTVRHAEPLADKLQAIDNDVRTGVRAVLAEPNAREHSANVFGVERDLRTEADQLEGDANADGCGGVATCANFAKTFIGDTQGNTYAGFGGALKEETYAPVTDLTKAGIPLALLKCVNVDFKTLPSNDPDRYLTCPDRALAPLNKELDAVERLAQHLTAIGSSACMRPGLCDGSADNNGEPLEECQGVKDRCESFVAPNTPRSYPWEQSSAYHLKPLKVHWCARFSGVCATAEAKITQVKKPLTDFAEAAVELQNETTAQIGPAVQNLQTAKTDLEAGETLLKQATSDAGKSRPYFEGLRKIDSAAKAMRYAHCQFQALKNTHCGTSDAVSCTGPGTPGSSSGGPPGGGPPGGCFAAGTGVLTPSGKSVPIESLAVGDAIMAVDPATGRLIPTTVAKLAPTVEEAVLEVSLSNGRSLFATPDHLTYDPAGGAYKAIADFSVGDAVLVVDAGAPPRRVLITSKRDSGKGKVRVYNFDVADQNHNYVAEGVVVHNLKDSDIPTY